LEYKLGDAEIRFHAHDRPFRGRNSDGDNVGAMVDVHYMTRIKRLRYRAMLGVPPRAGNRIFGPVRA
jgi:hypothetical protein